MNMIAPLSQNTNFYNNKQTHRNISFGTISRNILDKSGKIICRNDTEMFRDDLNWNILVNYISKKQVPQKIYCYACSDGSEPYSIALALIKKFGKEGAKKYFPIIARDKDIMMIKKAQQRKIGLDKYDLDNIKDYQDPIPFYPTKLIPKNDKYWRGAGEPVIFEVDKNLADCVDFKVGNIFNDMENIDYKNSVIFFRNVWPYLGKEENDKLLETFAQKFKPSTSLVVGFYDELSAYSDGVDFKYKLQSKNFFQIRPYIYERYIPGAEKMTPKTIFKSLGDEFTNMFLEKYEAVRNILLSLK